MIGLAAILRGLKTILGIAQTAKDVENAIEDVLDVEPVTTGQPLSHRDVEHQQAQIRSAARPFPPSSPDASDTSPTTRRSRG